MEKKKIVAKEAVADIRSGMSDAALMSKYILSNAGLQSLFDKLVNAGYIDLAEILERTAAFMGTVDITESFLPAKAVTADDGRQPSKSRAATRVNAQEAARDIRSGMDDFALMQKYRLSFKGLPSLFKKLMDKGLIQQIDLDQRNVGFENTVDVTDDMLSLSSALKALGLHHAAVATDNGAPPPPVSSTTVPTHCQLPRTTVPTHGQLLPTRSRLRISWKNRPLQKNQLLQQKRKPKPSPCRMRSFIQDQCRPRRILGPSHGLGMRIYQL